MINRIAIDNIGGITALDRTFVAPGVSIYDGVGKSSLFNALCALQFVARGMTHVSQVFPMESTPVVQEANARRIEIDFSSFGESYRYGFNVVQDGRTGSHRLVWERLLRGGFAVIQRDENKLTEYNSGVPSCQWPVTVDAFFLSTAPNNARYSSIAATRGALSNMFFIRPETKMMTSVIEQSASLQPNCHNFVSWFFSYFSNNPAAYPFFDTTLAQLLSGHTEVSTPADARGVRHLYVRLPNRIRETPFHCLSDGEKLSFIAAALCAFNRQAPGTVCVWDDFEQVILKANTDVIWSSLWACMAANGQLIGLCSHKYIPRQFGNPNLEWL